MKSVASRLNSFSCYKKGGAVLGSLKACIPAGAEYRTHIFTQGDYFPTTKANPYLALLLTNTKISNSSIKNKKKELTNYISS